jgi:hypothetical protein
MVGSFSAYVISISLGIFLFALKNNLRGEKSSKYFLKKSKSNAKTSSDLISGAIIPRVFLVLALLYTKTA